jgi:hypothetical protein
MAFGIPPCLPALCSPSSAPILGRRCRAACLQQRSDRRHKLPAVRAQLNDALLDYPLEQPCSTRLERNQHLSPVLSASQTSDVAVRLHPVDEFDRTMVSQQKSIRQRADGRLLPRREAPDCQKQQILLRLQTGLLRGNVPFLQKPADEVAQPPQRPIFLLGDLLRHVIILSYCDIFFQAGCDHRAHRRIVVPWSAFCHGRLQHYNPRRSFDNKPTGRQIVQPTRFSETPSASCSARNPASNKTRGHGPE